MSEKKPITIKLDKERTLKLDKSAIYAAEAELGESVLDLVSGKTLQLREARVFLWAALRHEDPSLSLQDVDKWITPARFQVIAKALAKAVADFFAEWSSEDGLSPGSTSG